MNINKNHLYYWLVYGAFFGVLGYINDGPSFTMVRTLRALFINMFLFYSGLSAIMKFKKKTRCKIA